MLLIRALKLPTTKPITPRFADEKTYGGWTQRGAGIVYLIIGHLQLGN